MSQEVETKPMSGWLMLVVGVVLIIGIVLLVRGLVVGPRAMIQIVSLIILLIAARQRIVEGAVGMVEMALDRLEEYQKLNLDEERKAAMVSNLLVVLCSEHAAQPVLNTGTLYQ